ncbi:GNAT family N-acetyltransferase [Paenibacillus filicis]|uniref:GNAT family N-acetyltransferase n=1 Tax=Paenibacillus gyeongsangnamensis TaxID=3388067 RepID=A0ABT4QGS6_9BACL|nr:GNAT family N-acetyltransferase [Paenibacillus filicis]MCZ8516083.1 GNAT family N-acetyltransferase [Paenibacillus filicis]
MTKREHADQVPEIRRVREEDMPLAVRLADSVFRDYDPDKKSFAKSHPLLFAPGLCQSFAAFIDGRPVSFVGLVPSIVRIGSARIHCCSIGGVCTHPDYRGRGYAGLILQRVMDHIDRAGASLLLVSGNRTLYQRANCFEFGSFRNYTLDCEQSAQLMAQNLATGITIREADAADWFGLRNAAATRLNAFEQSLWDLALLIEAEPAGSPMKQHHKVLAAERDGAIRGFAVIGVPYANAAVVPRAFEWAGEAPLVACLFAEALQRYNMSELTVPVAWHEAQLSDLLARAGIRSAEGNNVGTIHIVRPERLIEQLQPYFQQISTEAAGNLRIEASEDGTTRVHVKGGAANLDAQALVALMFDKEPEIDLDEDVLCSLCSLFPIPFPYTGGLNYV